MIDAASFRNVCIGLALSIAILSQPVCEAVEDILTAVALTSGFEAVNPQHLDYELAVSFDPKSAQKRHHCGINRDVTGIIFCL